MGEQETWLGEWLKSTLKDAERRLERLGRVSSAWECLTAYLGGGLPAAFGYNPNLAEALIGRDFRVAPRPTGGGARRSPAWDKLQRHKRKIQKKYGLDEGICFSIAVERHPELYRQLKKEWGGLDPFVYTTRARSEAERAAVAAAAIELLSGIDQDSEEGQKTAELFQMAFTAGFSLRDYQLRQRFPELSRKNLIDRTIRRNRKAGKAKAGSLAPHNDLLSRVVRHLEARGGVFPGIDDVLDALGDEVLVEDLVAGSDAGRPLPIRRVLVEGEEGAVDFAYADGSEKLVKLSTIRNTLSILKKRR